jgi:hypothetical protein
MTSPAPESNILTAVASPVPTMKRRPAPILALGFVALLALVRAQPPAAPAASPTVVIALSPQTLRFKPTREDISVGAVEFVLYQPRASNARWLDGVHVNGARPKTSRLYLKQIGKNEFALPALRIEFSSAELGGPLFLSIKACFNELTTQEDVPYYANHLSDRYALLTYCTDENNDPAQENARWGANRMKTLAEFKARLGQPIVIALNQTPLPAGGSRWPMINDGFQKLSAADLATIQQRVRDRGERFLISIAVRAGGGEDEASVFVGDHDYFEGARVYRVMRADGAWRIGEVTKVESGF